MYRRILSPVLLVLALGCLVYAIYRSTAEKIIIQEGTRQTTYGEPQHGLILGLCVFAGVCLATAVAMLPRDIRKEERTALSKRVP